MGLNVGNLPVKQVYVGSTPVKSVYVGSGLVWSATVQITLGTGMESHQQFREELADRGLDYKTVTEIPFDIELVGSGSARFLFSSCPSLTQVPNLDTSQVTDMWCMFLDCTSLTTVPALDTSGVTDMEGMFDGCSALTHVPDMNTSGVTSMGSMFYGCSALTDGNVRLIGRHPNVYTYGMIDDSGLTREPFFDAAGNPI